MRLTPKLQKAINIATEKHQGQNRRSFKRPYIVHPYSVMVLLSEFTDDEDVLAAAILHDILEDSRDYSFADMKKDFGTRVAKIVRQVSEDESLTIFDDPRESWEARKKSYLKKLRTDSHEAMMISAADKTHNLQAMIEAYDELGENLWKKFHAPLEKKLWYYGEVLKILEKRLGGKITAKLKDAYKKADYMFGQNRDLIGQLQKLKKVKLSGPKIRLKKTFKI